MLRSHMHYKSCFYWFVYFFDMSGGSLIFDLQKRTLVRKADLLAISSKIRAIKIPDLSNDPLKKKASDTFWETISNDIDLYIEHINNKHPFDHTCYSSCPNKCIRIFDQSYWKYVVAGFKKRSYTSMYKFPVKLISIFLVFLAGLFKIIRANQDGKA